MTVPQLSNLEAGTPENPGWKTMVKVAKALGFSLDEAAGLKTGRPLKSKIPTAISSYVERARKQLEAATGTLDSLSERLKK